MTRLQKLCLTGISIALVIVLSSYCQIPLGASIRLDFGYAVVAIVAMYLGGLYGGIVGFLARILNDIIFSGSISIWWAIGSAFFGFAIGLISSLLIKKIRKKAMKTIVLSLFIIVISFISFAGIVPIIASLFGIDYSFMLSIGLIASAVDAVIAIVIGCPVYSIIEKLPQTIFDQNKK